MKKPGVSLLFVCTFLFIAFSVGLFAGRNLNPAPIQISVLPSPTLAPIPAATSVPEAAGPVDLNTATLEQLDTLPGIGPAMAQRILDYRQAHGPFQAPEELLEIKGIGQKTLLKLLDHITIGGRK